MYRQRQQHHQHRQCMQALQRPLQLTLQESCGGSSSRTGSSSGTGSRRQQRAQLTFTHAHLLQLLRELTRQ
jgi:hypothetical protein